MMVDRTLDFTIDIVLHQPGPNRHFNESWQVDVPPDYQEQDILPFVRWQLERGVTDLEEEHLGEARAAKIIAAMELRLRAIEFVLRNAPHVVRTSVVATAVRKILDDDNDTLFSEWANRLDEFPEG